MLLASCRGKYADNSVSNAYIYIYLSLIEHGLKFFSRMDPAVEDAKSRHCAYVMCCPSIGELWRKESFGPHPLFSTLPAAAALRPPHGAVEVLREMRKLDREWIGRSYLSIARDISIAPLSAPLPIARILRRLPSPLLFPPRGGATVIPRSTCSRSHFHIGVGGCDAIYIVFLRVMTFGGALVRRRDNETKEIPFLVVGDVAPPRLRDTLFFSGNTKPS